MLEIPDILEYLPSQRSQFAKGQLRDEWYKQYPDIFDEQDYKNARDQQKNHFFEWFTAVRLYEMAGYLSLVEKYGRFKPTNRGPRKWQVVQEFVGRQLISPALLDLMQHPAKHDFPKAQQCPDLFVYTRTFSDWHLCETKAWSERFHGQQENYFHKLGETSGRQVVIVRLREIGLQA